MVCRMNKLIAVLLLSAFTISLADSDVEGEILLDLEHSLDDGKTWQSRGHLSVSGGRSTNDQNQLDDTQKQALRNQCAKGGLYLIKSHVQQGGQSLGVMRSYSSACSLVDSGMVDTITLQTDHRGRVLSLSLSAAAPTSSPGLRDTFKTKVVTSGVEPGPVPDTAAYIQRIEEEKRRQEKGEVPDNRSFLAKYWMYIVPVVLFMAINGAAAPEGS